MRQNLFAWTVETDPTHTRLLYRAVPSGAAVRCGCRDCHNFDAARPDHFPSPLAELLASLAVDPRKEVAVSMVAPLEGNRSLYSGGYLLTGAILAGRPHRGFPFINERVDVFEQIHPHAHVSFRPVQGSEEPWTVTHCIRLEFLVVLPWVLRESHMPPVNLDRGDTES